MVNYMCRLNGRAEVDLSYVSYMMEQDSSDRRQAEDLPISAMFSDKYRACSWRLIACWFTTCFIYYGVMLLLPSILGRVFGESSKERAFKYLFLISVTMVEVLSFAVCFYIMDHPAMGRRRSTYLGLAIVFAVSCLMVILGEDQRILLFAMFVVIKFMVTAVFMVPVD